MTWGYYNGTLGRGPDPEMFDRAGCFPLGNLTTLSGCGPAPAPCAAVEEIAGKIGPGPGCMTYALARGYVEMREHGADVLVPAGLAWLAARGVDEILAQCRAAIDAEYADDGGALRALKLPLRARDPRDARWASAEAAKKLFNDLGPDYNSSYCSDGCTIDHHPSASAQYLNALVFAATLLKRSPVGAAWPDGKRAVDGMVLPAVDKHDAKALQRIARDVVLPHLATWWGSSRD